MLSFNSVLRNEGVEPALVKLVRHRDTRNTGRPTPYQLWLANDGRLELYQRIQKRDVFSGAKLIASFVVTPLDETLFVGLFSVDERTEKAASGLIDPVSGEHVGGLNLYGLSLADALANYRGRLVIEWGPGYRSWVQVAKKQEKMVLELRRSTGEPPFPGFLSFCERLSQLVAVPSSWRTALSSVSGVYLLTSPETGRQYVGSAQGAGGFWGRWEEYVASGHGGNRRMQGIPAADYRVTILEVASSSAGPEALAAMESRWKRKLLSRVFGLNAN